MTCVIENKRIAKKPKEIWRNSHKIWKTESRYSRLEWNQKWLNFPAKISIDREFTDTLSLQNCVYAKIVQMKAKVHFYSTWMEKEMEMSLCFTMFCWLFKKCRLFHLYHHFMAQYLGINYGCGFKKSGAKKQITFNLLIFYSPIIINS